MTSDTVWTIVLIVSIIMYLAIATKETFSESESHSKGLYRACPNFIYSETERRAMEHNQLKATVDDTANWQVYLPCGYTNAEQELKQKQDIFKRHKGKGLVFAISGMDYLAAKDALWSLIKQKYGRTRAQIYMPESWSLRDINDVVDLKKQLSVRVKGEPSGGLYIMKKNVQRQEGLLLTERPDVQWATEQGYMIVQRMLQDPYLIDGRKVNLRIYVLFVCTASQLHLLVYNDGFVYYTPEEFEPYSMNVKKVITTGYIDRSVYRGRPLTLQDFTKYIDEIHGPSKSGEVLNNIKYVLSEVVAAVVPQLCRSHDNVDLVYTQLFGVDVQPNDQLNDIKLIEMNKGASQSVMDDRDGRLKMKLQRDVYEAAHCGTLPITNGFELIKTFDK